MKGEVSMNMVCLNIVYEGLSWQATIQAKLLYKLRQNLFQYFFFIVKNFLQSSFDNYFNQEVFLLPQAG